MTLSLSLDVFREKVILFLLAFTNFCHIVDFMILMPLGDVMMRKFDITPRQFSFLVASYSFSAGISSFLSAAFVDRFDRKKALLFAYGMFGIGTFICSISPTYEWLLGARILTGVFGGLIGGIVIAILSDLIPLERRSSAMGMVSLAFAFASVMGVPLSLWFADVFGWQAPFRFICVISLAGFYGIWRLMPPIVGHMHKRKHRPLNEMMAIFTDKNAILALVFAFLMVFGHFMIIPFITPYIVRNIGIDQAMVKYIYVLGGAVTLISAPIIGKMADKHGNFKVYMWVIIGSFIPILLLTHLTKASWPLIFFITTLFFVFVSGRMIPGQTMISAAVGQEKRGAFMNLRSSLLELGSASASFVSGLLVIEGENGLLQHYNWVGYLSIVIAGVTIFLAKKLKAIA